MDKEFKAAYTRLNPAQKEAVDTIEGPVLVIAGPGTGKTQLISLRTANILRRTDTDPASILCLTFTNFAATNMRERLTKYAGAGSHNVVVRTFHSFAAEVMNLYPDYFWNGGRLTLVPDAVQIEIIEDILSGLPLKNPLARRFAGSFTAINDVMQSMKLAKETGLTPNKLEAMLKVNQAYIDIIEPSMVDILDATLSNKKLRVILDAINKLPDQPIESAVYPLTSLSTILKDSFEAAINSDLATNKTTQTGKLKKQWVQTVEGKKGLFDERRRNEWWLAFCGVYESYRQELHKRGFYDYSDMILEVISQLEQNADLLSSVQERFEYVMIDEFQDTNAAQLRLANLVANHHLANQKPNLMAVGDDDQSIFAFNGAELNNMLAFKRAYKDTKIIVLESNYRSTQLVLDTAKVVIEQAEDRIVKRHPELTKNLKAIDTHTTGEITHFVYPTLEHQLSETAKNIQSSWKSDKTQSIAVLARSHDSLIQLSGYLSRLNVPIAYERRNNVLAQPLVKQLLLLSDIVLAIQKADSSALDAQLAILLAHPAWEVEPKTLWQLALNGHRSSWFELLLSHDDQHLRAIAQWLQSMAKTAMNENLPIIVETMLGLRTGDSFTSPLKEYYLSRRKLDNEYLEGLSGIQVLTQAVAEFSSARINKTTLTDFVRFTTLHRDLDKPITDESWFISGDRAVNLMTVHKAKGLEFDTVYVLDVIEDNWTPRHSGRKPPANLPLKSYGEQYDDYVRLLYVALTRAKKTIVLSSYSNDWQGKALLASPLISAVHTKDISSDELDEPEQVLVDALSWPKLQIKDQKTLLKSRVENFQLSATSLLNFLDVTRGGPDYFLEKQLLRIPQAKTAQLAYGTAIHRALQIAQQQVRAGSLKLSEVLDSFSQSLALQQITKRETERYDAQGRDHLKQLLTVKGFKLDSAGQAEVSLDIILPGSIHLNGKVDNLLFNPPSLLITDYKTGKSPGSIETKDKTKAVKAWSLKRQLEFYCLLATKSGRYKNIDTLSTRAIYIDSDRLQGLELKYNPSKDSLARLERLVETVWQHIIKFDLPDTSRYNKDISGILAFEDDLINGKV